jgi:hypothetical protein
MNWDYSYCRVAHVRGGEPGGTLADIHVEENG